MRPYTKHSKYKPRKPRTALVVIISSDDTKIKLLALSIAVNMPATQAVKSTFAKFQWIK